MNKVPSLLTKLSIVVLSILCTSCGNSPAKKGYEECKTFLRLGFASLGYSEEAVRFSYCDYVWLHNKDLASLTNNPENSNIVHYRVNYFVYKETSTTKYRDYFIYYVDNNHLEYDSRDASECEKFFQSAIDLVKSDSKSGEIGTIKD